MARSPIRDWMPFEIDRFFASQRVQGMKDFQRWWYVSLLLRAWQAEPPCHLPDDQDALRIAAGAPDEKVWDKHSALVLGAFDATGDGYRVNRRQLEIYEEKMGVRAVKKKNGMGGGRPRKTEMKPDGYDSVSEPSISSSAVVVALGSKNLKPDLVVGFALEDFDPQPQFDELCSTYPKPNRSYLGMQAFQRAVEAQVCVSRPDRNEICAALIRAAAGYKQAKRNTAKQFIPEMIAWLDRGIWLQDPACWEEEKQVGNAKQRAIANGINEAFS